jgi:hypothetical protein
LNAGVASDAVYDAMDSAGTQLSEATCFGEREAKEAPTGRRHVVAH